MELGATICRPRAPRCTDARSRRAATVRLPAAPPRRRGVRFEDTERWARGRVLAALLAGEEPPVRGERLERALAGLERDGLVVRARTGRRPSRESGGFDFVRGGERIGTPHEPRAARTSFRILALVDRESIERRDFPTGRRGYDPAAVDEHLRRVADEFEARVHQPPASLSAGASEQVRLILEAAEHGASELRARAGEEASDHVARVQVAADGMLSKLDALEAELNRLLSALRESGERLTEGLAELQADVADGHRRPPCLRRPAVTWPARSLRRFRRSATRRTPPLAALDVPAAQPSDEPRPACPSSTPSKRTSPPPPASPTRPARA